MFVLQTVQKKRQTCSVNTPLRVSMRKKIDLYNFETSSECIKLNFSTVTDNKENISPTGVVANLRKRSFSKREPLATKHSPTFEFFTTKNKRQRMSDSGVFMTPPTVKQQPMKSSRATGRKPQLGSTSNGKCGLKLANMYTQQVGKRDDKVFKDNKAKHLKTSRMNKAQSKEKLADVRVSPKLTPHQPSSSAHASTSTPSVSLRSGAKHSAKQQHIADFISPPKVSPVQKVDSPTVNANAIASPDSSGSPSFRCTRSSVKAASGVCSENKPTQSMHLVTAVSTG